MLKHQDPSSMPRTHATKTELDACTCNSSAGRQRQMDLGLTGLSVKTQVPVKNFVTKIKQTEYQPRH